MAEQMGYTFIERKRWVFLGLPWTFTKYSLKEDMINVKQGFLKITEDDCYMYKVNDVKLETSFMERIFGLGTVICYTGDVTDKNLELRHIKNARVIKDYILEQSEAQRIKRRTIATQNISHDGVDFDGDGLSDT